MEQLTNLYKIDLKTIDGKKASMSKYKNYTHEIEHCGNIQCKDGILHVKYDKHMAVSD